MKRIYSAANPTEANIVVGMLQAEGIDAHLTGHYLQGGVGEVSPLDIAGVFVPDHQVEQAERIISDYESQAGTSDSIKKSAPDWQEPLIILLIVFGILGLYMLLF